MIYVEYISRRPGIALEDFHRVIHQVQKAWEKGSGRDRLIVNAGRTWRLGRGPQYLGVWDTGDTGLERLDEWTEVFRNRGAVGDEATMSRVACIDFAGCYDALTPPLKASGHCYYAEQFVPAGTNEEVRKFYEQRALRQPNLGLNMVAVRIGKLAPEPGGLAIWSLPNFAALGSIARELDGLVTPIRLTAAGVYADIGEEIL